MSNMACMRGETCVKFEQCIHMDAECSFREGSHGSSLADQFVRTCANPPEGANLMFNMACMRGKTCVKFEQCIHMDAECSLS